MVGMLASSPGQFKHPQKRHLYLHYAHSTKE